MVLELEMNESSLAIFSMDFQRYLIVQKEELVTSGSAMAAAAHYELQPIMSAAIFSASISEQLPVLERLA